MGNDWWFCNYTSSKFVASKRVKENMNTECRGGKKSPSSQFPLIDNQINFAIEPRVTNYFHIQHMLTWNLYRHWRQKQGITQKKVLQKTLGMRGEKIFSPHTHFLTDIIHYTKNIRSPLKFSINSSWFISIIFIIYYGILRQYFINGIL